MDAAAPDLDACAREPIHIPGAIQPHGALLVLAPDDLRVLHASANAGAMLGVLQVGPAVDLAALCPRDSRFVADLRKWMASGEPLFLRTGEFGRGAFQVVGHQTPQGVVLEFEEPPASESETLEAIYPQLGRFLSAIEPISAVAELCTAAAEEVRAVTGFNRVLIYRFDPDWAGTVVAESRDAVLPSYLDLRFPASDIPAQARELYRLNRLRLIPDANYTPVAIEPALSAVDGAPLDLTFAALRSVSPVHLEYMHNMGTLSSMSISILVDGRLWGLVSCHHAVPKRVNAQVRTACDLLGQILSMQIGARERSARAARRIALKSIATTLLTRASRREGFQAGLAEQPEAWLALAGATGAAVLSEKGVICAGETPSKEALLRLAAWLRAEKPGELFATDCLSEQWPGGESLADIASGVLATSLSRLHPSYIMWFRPEVVRTVRWGGDPRKPVSTTGGRLNPRTSFEQWKEQVRLRALPWDDAEIESVRDFRHAIVDIVLKGAEERAALSGELQRSNKELESFSYSVSHDLRAPFRHIVGYAELLGDREKTLDETSRHYLGSIVEAALSAGHLVDDLLSFSQLGRASLSMARVDMNKLAQEVRRSLQPEAQGRKIEWRIGPLPAAWGDGALLRQALLNLLGNAVKYTRGRETAVISVEGEAGQDETRYTISDNGVGFDMAYAGKLFGVFQRLHRAEEFEGTGIGLALTQRVIERPGGRIGAQGTPGQGATFTVALPSGGKETSVG